MIPQVKLVMDVSKLRKKKKNSTIQEHSESRKKNDFKKRSEIKEYYITYIISKLKIIITINKLN